MLSEQLGSEGICHPLLPPRSPSHLVPQLPDGLIEGKGDSPDPHSQVNLQFKSGSVRGEGSV